MMTSKLYYVPAFEGRERDGSWGAAIIQLGDSCYNPFTGQTVSYAEVEALWEQGWITKLDSPIPFIGGSEPPKAIVVMLAAWAATILIGSNPPGLLSRVEQDDLVTFVFEDVGFEAFARARADAVGKELLDDPARYGVFQYKPLLDLASNLAHNSPYVFAAEYRGYAPTSVAGRSWVADLARVSLTPEDFNVFCTLTGVERGKP